MSFHPTDMQGLIIIEPQIFGDSRGYFFEAYNQQVFTGAGFDFDFYRYL